MFAFLGWGSAALVATIVTNLMPKGEIPLASLDIGQSCVYPSVGNQSECREIVVSPQSKDIDNPINTYIDENLPNGLYSREGRLADVNLVDLNDDGQYELILKVRPEDCGANGRCVYEVYEKHGDEWQAIFGRLFIGSLTPTDSYTNGYRDLFFDGICGQGAANQYRCDARFIWNGSTYEPSNTN